MKLTLIQPTEMPGPLGRRFSAYHTVVEQMFADRGFTFETIKLSKGDKLPDPARLDATLILGSGAAVYDNGYDWMEPLRAYVRAAYAAKIPMAGICFGHQIMAEALGGEVRRSNRGWGLGRHVYSVVERPKLMSGKRMHFAIACSHQDQVVVPPRDAQTFLSSSFTPYAGLLYRNGAAVSLQAHPELDDQYAMALVECRRGEAPDDVIETAIASFERPSDSAEMANYLQTFLQQANHLASA